MYNLYATNKLRHAGVISAAGCQLSPIPADYSEVQDYGAE